MPSSRGIFPAQDQTHISYVSCVGKQVLYHQCHTVICHFTKTPSNYHTIALILHASKVMLKIPQARLQQYMNRELPYVQAGLRKGRGTRDQIANICWIIKKAREFQKNIYFCFIDYAKAFDCVITTKCGKL